MYFANIFPTRALRRAMHFSLTVTLSASAVACSGDTPPADDAATADTSAAVAAAPQVIDISAGDYFYTMADTVSAGATTFRLATTGQEMHHVQLVRLDDGHTMEELMSAMQGGTEPAWAHLVGGPNAPVPNAATSSVTLDLTPGTYGVLCVIPSPDGAPHVAKGMSKMLVVTPSTAATALPTATARMTLTDYDFVLDAPLTAGSHVIEVKNGAAQPHEVFIAKLDQGKTAAELLQWLEKMDGPPPGAPMGGTVGLSSGVTNYVHADLAPGEYALICFIPDAGDKRPHFMHGMVKQITVM